MMMKNVEIFVFPAYRSPAVGTWSLLVTSMGVWKTAVVKG